MIKKTLSKLYSGLKNGIKRVEKKFGDKNISAWFASPNRERLRLEYNLNADSVVLDLGGYEGQWASDIFAMYLCKVYIFEPIKNFAINIEKRFAKNDKLKVFNFGLGGKTRKEKLFFKEDGTSIFGTGSETEDISVVDIVEFIEKHNLKKIDLIKLNIEGMEYEVLERLIDANLIKNITDIQIQFHNVAPDSETRMRAIQRRLAETHKPTYQYEFVFENWTLK